MLENIKRSMEDTHLEFINVGALELKDSVMPNIKE
jgi:hypothetical protein